LIRCYRCGDPLPEDPNRLDEIVRCRYCEELFCSDACAEEHELATHAGEALPPPDDQDRR